ncbi:hypothetical protein KI387_041271, partial [Taxus chinensis]
TCMVKTVQRRQAGKTQVCSAMSMRKAARKKGAEPMYFAALVGGWDEEEQQVPIPAGVEKVLRDYQD